MPGKHANGIYGLLSEYELDRDVAGVQGTYGWSVQSGAVTFSASLTFNVAAVAAGDYTVNSVAGSAYAGGTVAVTTQDATNPRVDVIVITSAGSVSVLPGTPAALTTSSGPVPPTPAATQLEIARIWVPASGTALSSACITDRRHPMSASQTVKVVGSNTTEQTMTSATAADLVTIAGLSIPVTSAVMILVNYRKSAAASQLSIGLKLNSTVVLEADSAAATGIGMTGSANEAQDGWTQLTIGPRSTNYLRGVTLTSFASGATGVNVQAKGASVLTNPFPNATITDVIIRGDSDGSATLGVKEVYVIQIGS